MHNHTIDWLRQTNISADKELAEKRWNLAVAVSKTLSRPKIVGLLRLFLFQITDSEFARVLTEELLTHDPEFPVAQNIQEVRLVAGLVIAATFEESSSSADAFALGVRVATTLGNRTQPIELAIVEEAEKYLIQESGKQRSNEFNVSPDGLTSELEATFTRFKKTNATGDAPNQAAVEEEFFNSIVETVVQGHRTLSARQAQLAEETGLLWWVLNEYSDALGMPVSELSAQNYALVAASEAAKRTQMLPPPPSIGPLLIRALTSCRSSKKELTFADFISATDSGWRTAQAKAISAVDCGDIVPFCLAIQKSEELGDVSMALKALPKLSGISGDLVLSPFQAALQYYQELIFLKALTNASAR